MQAVMPFYAESVIKKNQVLKIINNKQFRYLGVWLKYYKVPRGKEQM